MTYRETKAIGTLEDFNDKAMEMVLYTLSQVCETCAQTTDYCEMCIDGGAAASAVITDLYCRGYGQLSLDVLETFRPAQYREAVSE